MFFDNRLIGWVPAGLESPDATRIIQNPMAHFLSFSLCIAQNLDTFAIANASLYPVRGISILGGPIWTIQPTAAKPSVCYTRYVLQTCAYHWQWLKCTIQRVNGRRRHQSWPHIHPCVRRISAFYLTYRNNCFSGLCLAFTSRQTLSENMSHCNQKG